MPPTTDLIQALQHAQIEARFDLPTRILYSTDASIYQIEPLGVAFPHNCDELAAVIEIAATHQTPVLARGAGSSLAGQAIGAALILDCSRYLTHILEINPEDHTATVEPGVVLNSLNKAAAKYRLQFGPDPASAERATIGGSIANNATGAHSILYGMAADHLLSTDVVLADGSLCTFSPVSLEEARRKARGIGIEASIYQTALNIRSDYEQVIQNHWPATWRLAAGYNLNYLLPWTPGKPPGWQAQFEPQDQFQLPYPPISPDTLNLAPLLAGSEGTLAVLQRTRLRLVPLPRETVIGVLAFSDIIQACDAVPALLQLDPSAIELIPDVMIRLARSVPAFSHQLSFMEGLWVDGKPPNLLVVEFAGDDPTQLLDRARKLALKASNSRSFLIADSPDMQKKIWGVRKVGLGLLSSQPGERKSTAFIEDLTVPVEQLGNFVREMQRIFAAHGTSADYYAHASAGCLHIRPLLNLKSAQGVAALRSIASEAIHLTIRLGGAVSGEHGIGLARSEWLEEMYGDEVLKAFHELKDTADPQGVLNPGKILDAPRMDENLRFGPKYHSQPWHTVFDYTDDAGLDGAIEMCNGAGVCRKLDGVMCPSFQATHEEMHSTRGRANLLRALITRPPQSLDLPEVNQAVFEALDLCLACKGCKAECPSSVDVAKLKYEFLNHYYLSHRRKLRDYLFAFIGLFARLGHRFAWLANPILHSKLVVQLLERWAGLSARRLTPALSQQSLHDMTRGKGNSRLSNEMMDCLLLSDPFTEYYYPEAGVAALHVLNSLGYHVQVLPVLGAGRTMISKGFLPAARKHATHLVQAIERLDPQGRLPIVGVEPSEIYTLRDEYLDLFPGDEHVLKLAERAWMIDEFLVRPGTDGQARIQKWVDKRAGVHQPVQRKVQLHGHCYQKAQLPRPDGLPVGAAASKKMLEYCGYQVTLLDTGCCGMAGAFGYETEHYDISMQVGELSLFPAIRAALLDENVVIAASGVSCQAQIDDGTGVQAIHPILLVDHI